ncbi:SDR family NAD(P)-dependent oxidoreductase [Halospeciosus flavus]|uniref:SDR family NAD(P)-dependent oxidoreductase n=1 Tax=Halospeciosus flavus TaxID=3032283 RepID=UPI00361C8645
MTDGTTPTGRFDGRTALVTGAASGIGRATAERLADEGATVVVTDVDEQNGEAVVDEIETAGGDAVFRELDVTDADAFDAVVQAVDERHGLDVVVNNAGIAHPHATVEETDAETFERVLDVNVRGVWNGCQSALRVFKDRGEGAIVNVASLGGMIGLPRQGVYTLTKGAVLNFTRTVAAEAGPAGVRANAVCPGFVETEMGESFFEDADDPEEARERMERQYPLRRLGRPEEVAAAIAYLASDDASWVTGHGPVVDGGYSVA